ncbi:MAG: hypothetical protein ACYS9X_13865 [Planctomycetota bacterium]|jgi:hypothetical protein
MTCRHPRHHVTSERRAKSKARSGALWFGGRKPLRCHAGAFVSDCYVASYDLTTKKHSGPYAVSTGDRAPIMFIDGNTLWIGVENRLYRMPLPAR